MHGTDLQNMVIKLNERFGTQMVAITDVSASPDMIKAAHEIMDAEGK